VLAPEAQYSESGAFAVNDNGVVVGYVRYVDYICPQPVAFSGGKVTPILLGSNRSQVAAINNSGTVVGYGFGAFGPCGCDYCVAVPTESNIDSSNSVTMIPLPPDHPNRFGWDAEATDVNAHGVVRNA
jgi:hypothetical protein